MFIDNIGEMVASEHSVIALFTAPWCGPCKTFKPLFKVWADGNPQHFWCMVDLDEHMEAASSFGVVSIPTVVRFVDGVEVSRTVGAVGVEKFFAAHKVKG
jgi:thioredoxin 1